MWAVTAKAVSLYNEVVVLYSEGIDLSLKRLCEIRESIEEGIRTIRLRYRKSPIPKTSYFIYLWAIAAAFRKLLNEGWRPDVIHAHVYSAGVPAVILGKIYGIPVVVTEHFSGFPRRIIRGFERIMAKFAFEGASVVCPVSEDLKRHIESYGIRTRFCVVPNAVDMNLFSPSAKSNQNGLNPTRKKRLLLVALLDPIKGVPYLLEALSRLKEKRNDFVLDIVGDGSHRAEYEQMALKLGLKGIVVFHGLKSKPEVAEFMKKSDFFVLPSVWENLPCVLVEAMASGLPIIATKVGGIPEMVNEKTGILVPPKDAESLAEAIDHMLDHYQDYFTEGIMQFALRRFSYKAVGKQFDEIYKRVIQ